jgi:hypothetical protein
MLFVYEILDDLIIVIKLYNLVTIVSWFFFGDNGSSIHNWIKPSF